MSNIIKKDIELSVDLSDDVKDLLRNLLQKDRTKRLGSQGGAREIMKHPWFSDIDWNEVKQMKLKMPFPYQMKTLEELLKPQPSKPKSYIAPKDSKDNHLVQEQINQEKLKQFNNMGDDQADEENRVSFWSFIRK